MDILDAYILTEPSNQNILDIFKDEWASQLPADTGLVTKPGFAGLFEDGRIIWAEQVFGSFANWNILELGPLEGGHSYMLQKSNANKIIAIEANSRAFLKCLCIKEILNLHTVEYKLGDFVTFLEKDDSKYDLVLASGVLYHMADPVKVLHLISKVTDRVFLWTHYYDEPTISSREELKVRFEPVDSLVYEGVSYDYSTQSYQAALNSVMFCGGLQPTTKWLTRDSILKALKNFGFVDIQINFDDINHPNGPAFAICAKKAGF